MTDDVVARIDELERRITELYGELRALRAEALAPPAPRPSPPPAPAPSAPPPAAAAPRPPRYIAGPPEPAKRSFWDRDVSLPRIESADLLGARALAWAGGIVTLLGVVFFFVLAVNRGWIGPVERVALGAVASALLFGAGAAVRARYGQLHSAVAAVGAGIAGGYATLLAAAALYGLVPDLGALTIAAAIAAAGTAVALRWTSETVAAIGLVGATVVPLVAVLEDDPSALGTAFAAIVFAAAAVVSLARGWDRLLVAAAAASLPQAALLVSTEGEGAPAAVVAVAAAYWLLFAGVGVGRHVVVDGGRRVGRLSATLLVASAAFAGSAAPALLNGETLGVDREGLALLAVAASFALAAAATFARYRELSALLGALALTVGAIAAAVLLAGGTLAVVWAAEAALLAWLARRIEDTRYGAAAVAYLGLAAGHLLALDAPPRELFRDAADPFPAVPVALAVAAGAAVVALHAPRWRPFGERAGLLAEPYRLADAALPFVRPAAVVAAAAFVLEAASLSLLEAGTRLGSFDWGQVAVTALWALAGAAVLVAARGRPQLDAAGVVVTAAAGMKLAGYDVPRLDDVQSAIAALVLAAALLAAAALRRDELAPVLALVGGATAGYGALALGGSSTADGLWLLAAAAPFAAVARLVGAARDTSTAAWVAALGLGLLASWLLLEHTALVAAWSAAALVLAGVAEAARERRLQLASFALAALAVLYALVELAPPGELLSARREPADGVPALVAALVALAGAFLRPWRTARRDGLDDAVEELQAARPRAFVAAAVGGLYAGSLTLLGASQAAGGDVTSAFQRGHTMVSAFWGLVGLALLYLGLKRASTALRLGGFALFGVSLAKIFLYDLSMLSSVTRALSFLAVGAVLLLAGFFYQRLSAPPGPS